MNTPTTRKTTIYGQPLCDDPRDFTPDEQVCTPAEIAAWKDAVRRADAGENVEIPRHFWIVDEHNALTHVSYEPWGVGVSVIDEEEGS